MLEIESLESRDLGIVDFDDSTDESAADADVEEPDLDLIKAQRRREAEMIYGGDDEVSGPVGDWETLTRGQ